MHVCCLLWGGMELENGDGLIQRFLLCANAGMPADQLRVHQTTQGGATRTDSREVGADKDLPPQSIVGWTPSLVGVDRRGGVGGEERPAPRGAGYGKFPAPRGAGHARGLLGVSLHGERRGGGLTEGSGSSELRRAAAEVSGTRRGVPSDRRTPMGPTHLWPGSVGPPCRCRASGAAAKPAPARPSARGATLERRGVWWAVAAAAEAAARSRPSATDTTCCPLKAATLAPPRSAEVGGSCAAVAAGVAAPALPIRLKLRRLPVGVAASVPPDPIRPPVGVPTEPDPSRSPGVKQAARARASVRPCVHSVSFGKNGWWRQRESAGMWNRKHDSEPKGRFGTSRKLLSPRIPIVQSVGGLVVCVGVQGGVKSAG